MSFVERKLQFVVILQGFEELRIMVNAYEIYEYVYKFLDICVTQINLVYVFLNLFRTNASEKSAIRVMNDCVK